MRIEADVLGVEQAVDFNTMETSACVVIDVLGEVMRIPISEEQMERLTIAAVQRHQSPDAFEETREVGEAIPPEQQVRLADAPEREFSVMRELSEHPVEPEGDEPPGMEGIFGSESEAAKVEKLRQRQPPPQPGTFIAQAVVPSTPVMAPSGLPRLPGTAADDDFPQG